MSSPDVEPKKEVHHDDQPVVEDTGDLKQEKGVLHQEVLGDQELMNEAFHGENAEHEQGLWESAKNHPMACIWAFIFCFTIVSLPLPPIVPAHVAQSVTTNRRRSTMPRLHRSWSLLTCS